MHFGQVCLRRINRRAHRRKRKDPTKSEIVIRVAVRGGPRRCNGARLIRPPAANNILIWRPLAVQSLFLLSLSRLRCSPWSCLSFARLPWPPASFHQRRLPTCRLLHTPMRLLYAVPRSSLRRASSRIFTLLYGPTRTPLTYAPNFRGLHEKRENLFYFYCINFYIKHFIIK